MTSQEIRRNVVTDFIALLNADGIANVFREGIKRASTASGVAVGVINRQDGLTDETGGTAGYWRIDVLLDCISVIQKDEAQTVIDALEKSVLDAVNSTDSLTNLNNLSSYNTYKTIMFGTTDQYVEGRTVHNGQILTVYMQPMNATTTTTTTTSTSTSTTSTTTTTTT